MPAPTPPLHLPADLPQPGPRRLALHVSPAAEKALRQGHPWLYAESIRRQSHDGQPGDLAVIYDGKERFLGIGLYDPASPLRVKLLQHGQPARIDADWFAAQVQQAAARRAPLAAQGTTGCRLIHGENDGLPGLVVDRYGATLVLKLYAAVWPPHLRALLPALVALPGVERVVLRLNRQLQAGGAAGLRDATTLAGTPPDGPVLFTENGLTFAVDVLRGHKTGFFCDQRDNRAQVRALAAGRQVLDVFAYVGAFALSAAAGGATDILSVETSAPALAAAQQNFALNQHLPAVAAARYTQHAGDAFAALHDLAAQTRRFDMVILDPPTFASRGDQTARALEAYRRLVRLALPLLAPAGVFVMASCSSRVSAADFFAAVADEARCCGRPLHPLAHTGHALDHPVRFAEGEYLKCLFASVP